MSKYSKITKQIAPNLQSNILNFPNPGTRI